MCFNQEAYIGLPLLILVNACDWPPKPVRTLEREGAALLAQQSPTHRVLPIGGMHCNFPDVVPIVRIVRWPPCRFGSAQAANRPTQIGAVPRFAIERLVEHQ